LSNPADKLTNKQIKAKHDLFGIANQATTTEETATGAGQQA